MRSKLLIAGLAGAALVLVAALFVISRDKPTSTAAAANVNGHAIEQKDVVAELDAIAGNDAYVQAKASSTGTTVRIRGDEAGSYDAAFVAGVLQHWVVHELIRAEVDRLDLQVDGECRVAARNAAVADAGGDQVFNAFPKAYQDQLVQWNADELILTAHLADQACVSPDAAKAYYDAHQDEFQEVCLSISQGGDFTSLGCKPKNEIPDDFLAAAFETPVGQVSDPVQTTEGLARIRVDDRRQLPFDQVRDQAAQLAAVSATDALNQWVRQAAASATITVDPHYGTWNQQQLKIDPPA